MSPKSFDFSVRPFATETPSNVLTSTRFPLRLTRLQPGRNVPRRCSLSSFTKKTTSRPRISADATSCRATFSVHTAVQINAAFIATDVPNETQRFAENPPSGRFGSLRRELSRRGPSSQSNGRAAAPSQAQFLDFAGSKNQRRNPNGKRRQRREDDAGQKNQNAPTAHPPLDSRLL